MSLRVLLLLWASIISAASRTQAWLHGLFISINGAQNFSDSKSFPSFSPSFLFNAQQPVTCCVSAVSCFDITQGRMKDDGTESQNNLSEAAVSTKAGYVFSFLPPSPWSSLLTFNIFESRKCLSSTACPVFTCSFCTVSSYCICGNWCIKPLMTPARVWQWKWKNKQNKSGMWLCHIK